MKQYTNEIQTAKLVELGVKKPNGLEFLVREKDNPDNAQIVQRIAYSIGELIEILPDAICESKDDSYHYFLSIETDSLAWKVFYESEDEVTLCSTFGVELIDALHSMLTLLKKHGTL